jgi:outer membrane protein OmpA-like peptidoglycan-associated protein
LYFVEPRPVEQPIVQKPDPVKPGGGGGDGTPVDGDRVGRDGGDGSKGPAVKGSIVELLPNGSKGSPLDGVNLTVLQQQKTIGSGSSANGGKFDLPVTDPSGKLVVVARKSGYFTNRVEVDANNLSSLYNMEMERIVLNEPTSKMPAAAFNLNSYQLTPEEQGRLNQVVTVLQDNPDVRMELAGHTCPLGPANYNLVLSQQRAEAVKQFLVSRGINPNYLRAVGYGESQLKVPNPQNETQLAANRRTEFVVIGYGSNAPAASEIAPLPGATAKPVEASVGTATATTGAKPNCPHHYNGRCFDLVDGKFYVVKPGDTVYGVSKAFGMSVEDVMSLNKLKSTLIVVNQKLQVKK